MNREGSPICLCQGCDVPCHELLFGLLPRLGTSLQEAGGVKVRGTQDTIDALRAEVIGAGLRALILLQADRSRVQPRKRPRSSG